MYLSARAYKFLTRLERRLHISDRNQIIAALENSNLPVFEPVITFQQEYGGFVVDAFLEIVFGIINLQADSTAPYFISGEEYEEEKGIWYFECADRLYQMWFHIDQYGRYYEDREIIASSVDKFVESCAISTELAIEGGWQPIKKDANIHLTPKANLSHLGLHLIAEASDEYGSWWVGKTLCIHIQGDKWEAWSKTLEGERLLQKRRNYFI